LGLGALPLHRPGARRRRPVLAGAQLAAAAGLALSLSHADAQVLPGAVQPGRDRAGPSVPGQPDFDFSIIAPHRSPVPKAVDEVHFQLTDIKIVGAVTIPAERFRPLYANLLGKDVTLADILNVADAIEAQYRAAGYLLVRAFVPPQRVKDGIFTIDVVEGHLERVTVQGANAQTSALIGGYLESARSEQPLTVASLERGLLLANDLPGVKATGVLRPAPNTPGASDLVVDTSEPWITGGLAVDNRGSRFSGLWTIAGDVEFNSLFGPDQLAASVTLSPSSLEQIAGQLSYRRAIGDDGLVGSLIGSITHGQPGSTLTAFNVLTDSWAVGPRLTYPLIRSRTESLILDGGFTVQDAKIGLLGAPFSHDQWRVLDIGGSYQRADVLGGIWTSTFDIAQGLPILGASPNRIHGLPNPNLSRLGALTDFTKITGYSRLTVPLPDSFTVVLAVQGQYSFAPLITGEQIAFGGNQIGRGYDPGAITGDHGLGGSLELHYDFRFPESVVRTLEPYIFTDGAKTWFIQRGAAISPALIDQTIASAGGGVRIWLPYNFTAALEGARTFNPVLGSDGGKRATKLLVNLALRF
jgi:hemolysin activation/secretion protein